MWVYSSRLVNIWILGELLNLLSPLLSSVKVYIIFIFIWPDKVVKILWERICEKTHAMTELQKLRLGSGASSLNLGCANSQLYNQGRLSICLGLFLLIFSLLSSLNKDFFDSLLFIRYYFSHHDYSREWYTLRLCSHIFQWNSRTQQLVWLLGTAC